MTHMYGAIEAHMDIAWYSIVEVATLILPNRDLNGCLFGVGDYAGFIPLFPDRGVPPDLGLSAVEDSKFYLEPDAHPSWVSWRELAQVDWSETAPDRDLRVSEYDESNDVAGQWSRKWNEMPGLEWIREILDEDPSREVRHQGKIYRRTVMTRADALDGTEFPLVMKLMECLATRFGDSNVRLFVWFD